MRKTSFTAAIFALAAAALPLSSAEALDMDEGRWESKFERAADEAMEPDIIEVETGCVTKGHPVPPGFANMELVSLTASGNTLKWRVQDKIFDAFVVIDAEVVYEGSVYSGFLDMYVTEKDKPERKKTIKINGKRIGECDKAGK